jgi:hypothetical protein
VAVAGFEPLPDAPPLSHVLAGLASERVVYLAGPVAALAARRRYTGLEDLVASVAAFRAAEPGTPPAVMDDQGGPFAELPAGYRAWLARLLACQNHSAAGSRNPAAETRDDGARGTSSATVTVLPDHARSRAQRGGTGRLVLSRR